MNFKSTALLFGLVLAMLWTFGLMLALKRGTAQENSVMPTLNAEPDVVIDTIRIQRKEKDKKDEEIIFTKDKDNWRMKQPPVSATMRVESFKINQIVNQVKDARRDDEADPATSNLAFYELEQPRMTVTLKGRVEKKKDDEKAKGPEKEWKLFVGKEKAGFIYVTASDQPGKVVAVRKSALDSIFFADPNSLRPKTLLDVIESTARLIDIHKSKPTSGEVGELELAKNDDATWRFVTPHYGLADFEGPKAPESKLSVMPPRQEGGVKGLLGTISNIRVGSDADFVPLSDAPMGDFGVEEGKENIRIRVSGSADKKDDAKKDDAPKEALLIGFKVQGKEQYYARVSSDQGVVKIEAKLIDPIIAALKDPGRLRSRDMIPAETKTVDAIDIRQGKDLNVIIKLRHADAKPWQVYFGAEAKKADEKSVQSFLEALQGKREVKDFIDAPEADAKKQDAELGFNTPSAEVVLYSEGLEKPDKKDKDDKDEKKKDESKDDKKSDTGEPKLKKDVKPLVTLVFGKVDMDLVYVKRTTQDGTVARLQVPKSILEKAAPAEGAIAFLDSALPSFEHDKAAGLELDRGKDRIVIHKGTGEQSGRWLLKDLKDYAGKNFADTPQMNQLLGSLSGLRVQKWLHKIGPKDDLEKYGLTKPDITVTVTVNKGQPTAASAAGIVGLASLGTPEGAILAAASIQAGEADKGEPLTFKFSKEMKDKDTPVVYGTRSGSDLLFQVAPAVVTTFRDADLRDRSWLTLLQPVLDATLVGMLGSPDGTGALWALSPLTTGRILSFDSDKASEIKLAVRTRFELRNFAFQYNAKDKTWQEKSGLTDFTLDADKIKQLLSWLSELNAERFVFLTGGPREENKLTAKDATVKVDVALENGQIVSLTVGSAFEGRGFLATSNAWPDVVFVVPANRVDPILEGPGYFGKGRVAAR